MVGTQRTDESSTNVALQHPGHICRAVVMECLVVARVRGAINITEVNELNLALFCELRANRIDAFTRCVLHRSEVPLAERDAIVRAVGNRKQTSVGCGADHDLCRAEIWRH